MGMYDTVLVDIECPHCHENVTAEMQTKKGLKTGSMYRIGDNFVLNAGFKNDYELSYDRPFYVVWMGGFCPSCHVGLYGNMELFKEDYKIYRVMINRYVKELENHIIIEDSKDD